MKKSFTQIIRPVAALIASAVLFGAFSFAPAPTASADSGVHTYAESTDEIVNPAAGFYKRVNVKLKRNDGSMPVDNFGTATDTFIDMYANGVGSERFGIIQLCFDLSDFSSNAKTDQNGDGSYIYGTDAEIDGNALEAVGKVFASLRTNKAGAVVRFDYNRYGVSDPVKKDQWGNPAYLDAEPSAALIKKHVASVASVISEYSDVVLGIESGMLGPWGEQHSTTTATSGPDIFYDVVETWLENTPEKIGIAVRRPLFFTYWANKKYGLDLTVDDLGGFDRSAYPESQRVGVFNDGYLGSSSDLGTFTNRAVETAFIGEQAENTFYGGELVADSGATYSADWSEMYNVIGDYNKISFLENEGFITHTSYLNIDWNNFVFKEYKKNTYDGADPIYKGKTSEFTFVKNRLGYRLYLSESVDPPVVRGDKIPLKFTVSNAGFSRVLVPTRAELVFEKGTYTRAVDCSAVDLSSIPSAGSKVFEFSADVPDLPAGDYEVYLRAYTEYGAEIKFANDLSVCAADREGVRVAEFSKSAAALTGIAITAEPTKKVYTVGDALDLDGLVVTATYGDGSSERIAVTTDMISGFDTNTAGTKTVTVDYGGKTASFTVTVKNPSVVLTDITVSYSGRQYYASESFDRSELTVTAVYSDNSRLEVTDYTLSDFDMTAGTKTVTVTYVDDGVAETAEFSFTVKSVELTGIAITAEPTKKAYAVGDALDLGGLVVTATYNDGSEKQIAVTADMLSGFDTNTAGTKTVTVDYEGKTAAFDITVRETQVTPPDTPGEEPPSEDPPGGDPSELTFFARLKNFVVDNAVAVGCVSAAVATVIVITVVAAVLRKRKK